MTGDELIRAMHVSLKQLEEERAKGKPMFVRLSLQFVEECVKRFGYVPSFEELTAMGQES